MKLIKSTTFTNSFTNEHLVTIALYRREVSYVILSEFGYKMNGQTRLGKFDADEYYNNLIQETRQAFNSMKQPFTTI